MSKARRYNKDKLRYELISQIGLEKLAEVYTKGAEKYTLRDQEGNIIEDGSNNWRKGLSWMDTIASVQRHIEAFKRGEDVDPELLTLHLSNASWGLFALLEQYKTYPELDDRPKFPSKKYGLDIDGVIADFHKHICEFIGIDPEEITHWNDPDIKGAFEKVKKDDNFWKTIPMLTKPEDVPFEVHCYITSRSIDPKITQDWLNINGYPLAPLYCVGHEESKVQIAKESGVEIFIDDKYENYRELNEAGICTFLFDAPHNKKHNVNYRRIYSLKELI